MRLLQLLLATTALVVMPYRLNVRWPPSGNSPTRWIETRILGTRLRLERRDGAVIVRT